MRITLFFVLLFISGFCFGQIDNRQSIKYTLETAPGEEFIVLTDTIGRQTYVKIDSIFQSLTKSNDTLFLEGGGFVVLDGFVDTDNQLLTKSNDTLFLEGGGFVVLDGFVDTDNQTLSRSNDTIYLVDGGFVIDNVDDGDTDPTNELFDSTFIYEYIELTDSLIRTKFLDTLYWISDGQSNSKAQDSGDPFNSDPDPGVQTWDGHTSNTWITADPDNTAGSDMPNSSGERGHNPGPWQAAKAYRLDNPNTLIRIVAAGTGSKSINEWNNVGGIDTEWIELVDKLSETDYSGEWDAFFWQQGERDVEISTPYATYIDRFYNMLYRLDTAGYIDKNKTPVVCGHLADANTDYINFNRNVWDVINVDGHTNVGVGSRYGDRLMSELKTKVDGVHYTNDAFDTIGLIYYNTLLSLPYHYNENSGDGLSLTAKQIVYGDEDGSPGQNNKFIRTLNGNLAINSTSTISHSPLYILNDSVHSTGSTNYKIGLTVTNRPFDLSSYDGNVETRGINILSSNNGATGTFSNNAITAEYGLNSGAARLSEASGIKIIRKIKSGSMGYNRGLWLLDDGSTTTVGVDSNWSIYNAMDGPSYFRRNVGIGILNPDNELEIGAMDDPTIKLVDESLASSYTEMSDIGATIFELNKVSATDAFIEFNPEPGPTNTASFRYFLGTNTTGAVVVNQYVGDGSNDIQHQFNSKGNSYMQRQSGGLTIGSNESPGPNALRVDGTLRVDNLAQNNALDQIIVANGSGVFHYRDASSITSTETDPIFNLHLASSISPADTSRWGFNYWTQNSTDLYYNVGNVGIGTGTPDDLLHINDGTNPALRIGDNTVASSYSRIQDLGNEQMILEKIATGAADAIIQFDPISSGNNSSIRAFLNTNTSGTVRMNFYNGDGTSTINNHIAGAGDNAFNRDNGNTIIGSNNTPTAQLDIDGDIRIRTVTNQDTFSHVLVKDATTGLVHYRRASTLVSSTPWSVNGSDLYVTTYDVGIGTSGPGANLHIVDPVDATIRIQDNTQESYTDLIDSGNTLFQLNKTTTTGNDAIIEFNPQPAGNTNAVIRNFLETNTTGEVAMNFYKGDGTSTINHKLSSDVSFNRDEGEGFFNGRLSVGSLGNVNEYRLNVVDSAQEHIIRLKQKASHSTSILFDTENDNWVLGMPAVGGVTRFNITHGDDLSVDDPIFNINESGTVNINGVLGQGQLSVNRRANNVRPMLYLNSDFSTTSTAADIVLHTRSRADGDPVASINFESSSDDFTGDHVVGSMTVERPYGDSTHAEMVFNVGGSADTLGYGAERLRFLKDGGVQLTEYGNTSDHSFKNNVGARENYPNEIEGVLYYDKDGKIIPQHVATLYGKAIRNSTKSIDTLLEGDTYVELSSLAGVPSFYLPDTDTTFEGKIVYIKCTNDDEFYLKTYPGTTIDGIDSILISSRETGPAVQIVMNESGEWHILSDFGIKTEIGSTTKVLNDGTQNLNASTGWTTISIWDNSSTEFDDGAITWDGANDQFIIDNDGRYEFKTSLYFTGSAANQAIELSYYKNGSRIGSISHSTVVTNSSGLTKGSALLIDEFELNDGDEIEVRARREGAIGTFTLSSGLSYFSAKLTSK